MTRGSGWVGKPMEQEEEGCRLMRVKDINRNLIETFFFKGSKENKRAGAGKPHYKTRKEQSG